MVLETICGNYSASMDITASELPLQVSSHGKTFNPGANVAPLRMIHRANAERPVVPAAV